MPKGHHLSDADKYKCISAVVMQLDISKANVDWDKVAADIGAATTQIARQRFVNLVKHSGGGKGSAGSRKVSVAAKTNMAPKKAPKRKAFDTEDEDGGQADYEYDVEEAGGSVEVVEKAKGGKRRQARGKGAKRAKMENGDYDFENANSVEESHQADEYHQDATTQAFLENQFKDGSDVEDWLNQ